MMKKHIKKFVNILALLMTTVFCLSLTACEDIKTMTVEIQICDYSKGELFADSEYALEIDLYRHLAPKTVDAVIKYTKEGYYDNAVFYLEEGFTNQIMVGELKYDGTTVTQNAIKPQIVGEFENRAVQGSDLINRKGYVGLWRTWTAVDNNSNALYQASNGMDSGRANLFLPTDAIYNYDGYFCVFGKFDTTSRKNSLTISAIKAALDGVNYETYVQYYTGNYDENKPNENYGLTFHCISLDEFNRLADEDKAEIFVAKDRQYIQYNKKSIRLPKNTTNGQVGAMIKKVTIK